MAGLLNQVLPSKAYTHYDSWAGQLEIRAPYKPQNTVAERAQSVFGMDPKVRRLGFLPYPKGALACCTPQEKGSPSDHVSCLLSNLGLDGNAAQAV